MTLLVEVLTNQSHGHLFSRWLAVFCLAAIGPSCAYVGKVKPVAEKDQKIQFSPISEHHSDWEVLPNDPEDEETESDVAYQNKKTASIVSLSSSCREGKANQSFELRQFTDQLFLGMTDITDRSEKMVNIQGWDGLETTLTGRMNQRKVRLRALVFRSENCLYDVMLVSSAKRFQEDLEVFSQFVSSLRL